MKCGVAEGWQYPSTRGNLLTAEARWRYSLDQERSAHSDTTASVCAPRSHAVIYDASHAITLSLTLIQQFIYWCACIRAEVSFLRWGGQNNCLPSTSATSIVSQETSHVTWFIGGKPDEACFFALVMAHRKVPHCSVWCYREQLKWISVTSSSPTPRQVLEHMQTYCKSCVSGKPTAGHRNWCLTWTILKIFTVICVITNSFEFGKWLLTKLYSAFWGAKFGPIFGALKICNSIRGILQHAIYCNIVSVISLKIMTLL